MDANDDYSFGDYSRQCGQGLEGDLDLGSLVRDARAMVSNLMAGLYRYIICTCIVLPD